MDNMSQEIKKLNELAKEWQKTRSNDIFEEIYNQLKPAIKYFSKGNDDQSDALWVLFNVLLGWKESSGVWFFVYYKLCMKNYRTGEGKYNLNKKRHGFQKIPIHGTVGYNNKKTYADIIPDPASMDEYERVEYEPVNMNKIKQYVKYHTRNKPQQYEIIKRLMENKKQEDIAKELNVTQGRISKAIKNIRKEPWADKLKQMLKGEI